MKRNACQVSVMRVLVMVALASVFIGYGSVLSVQAQDANRFPDVSGAECVYLAHVESDTVLLEKHTLSPIAPASTVKMMTGLLAIELFQEKLDTVVTITEDMVAGIQGASLSLKVGMCLTVRDLLYACICGGYNDAARALAIVCSGTVSDFVAQMNYRANLLDMVHTTYFNPTGWDTDGMRTTLSDVVLLAKAALQNPLYMQISSTSAYTVKGDLDKIIYNRNALISPYYASGYENRRASGLIAGMTDQGGYCVVSSLQYDNATYLCAVMGAKKTDERIESFAIANALLTHCYQNYTYHCIAKQGEYICDLPVGLAIGSSKSDGVFIPCVLERDILLLLPDTVDIEKDLDVRWSFHDNQPMAPMEAGAVVGSVGFYQNDECVAYCRLLAGEAIDANPLLLFLYRARCFLTERWLLISVGTCLVLFVCLWGLGNRRLLPRKRRHYCYFTNQKQ